MKLWVVHIKRFWLTDVPGERYKIIVVGLDNAGKTGDALQVTSRRGGLPTLQLVVMLRACLQDIRFELKDLIVIRPPNKKDSSLYRQVWDLGGQERLRTSWATYYRGTHAVINELSIADLKDAMTPAEITDALSLPIASRTLIGIFKPAVP
ncbi:hypothetical protein HAX54_038481 [Datura stramonium]|uniref:Uncharacterized protein n=1 Tax=Datura stramonium TaxID=4076 RepID=A0ABS8VJV3_DATST|nr:hypothetical protein [Datura stramonium]